MATTGTTEHHHEEDTPVACGSKGKGKCGKGAIPPAPVVSKGKGKGANHPVANLATSLSQEIAARARKHEVAARVHKGVGERNATTSEPGLPWKLVALLMDGRQIELSVKSNDWGRTVKQEVSDKLEGISASRLKLIAGTTVLHDFQTLADARVSDGDALTVLILSPLHGALHRSGLEVPTDVQEHKMELNDAFAEIAKRRLLPVS
jgi:hypothetical protein